MYTQPCKIIIKNENIYLYNILLNKYNIIRYNFKYSILNKKKKYLTIDSYNLYLKLQYSDLLLFDKNFKFLTHYKYIHKKWHLNFFFNNKFFLLNYTNNTKKIINQTNTKNYMLVNTAVNFNRNKYTFMSFKFNRRVFYTYLNFLFFNTSTSNFIFSEVNINYLHIYFKEYNLLKLLLNYTNIKKWKNFFDTNFLNNFWYFNKINIMKLNVLPLDFLNNNKLDIFNSFFLQYQIKSIQWFLNFMLKKSINKLFNNNLFLNINKYNEIQNINITEIKNKVTSLNVISNLLLDQLINIIILTIFYKDPQVFIQWVKYNMRLIFFKKQNNFITLIGNLFKIIFLRYGIIKNFIGYKIIIKGKLNKIGNVRKKKIILSGGKSTLSNINYRSDYMNDTIFTVTGVIGIKIIINYI